MENYIVSARKYRPATFRSVVGQQALTATLKNAIATGRLAHSYLFCGSRGVGKTSCARIMAKTINCENPTADGEACNECASCRSFNDGNSLNIIELDAASNNGVDDMRQLIEQVQVPPSSGRYRVFIIDEVHMLSAAAFNAFLKTLEEPPSYVVFILATTEKHKILPTILSRCQIYDFSRITIQDMIDHMKYVAEQEGISAEEQALNVIAQKADGAMRDALSIFDQVAASSRGNITYQSAIDNLNVLDSAYYSRLLDCFLKEDVLGAWLIYKEIRDKGFDSQFFINGLASYFRDLMVARDPATINLLEAGDEVRSAMAQSAAKCDPVFLYKAMDLCNDADLNYRIASNKQFLVELTLAKICQLRSPSPANADGKGGGLKKIAVTTSHGDTAQAPRQNQDAAASAATVSSAQPVQSAAQPEAAPAASPKPVNPSPAPSRPSPAPAPAGAQAAARPGRGPRLSLRSTRAEAEAPKPAEAGSAPLREQPYTPDQMRKAWENYIETHPTEHILINTMRVSLPEQVGNDRFKITVENDRQLTVVNQSKGDILRHLHNMLNNDSVDFDIEINQGESSPVTWNQRQVLERMVENNAALKEFIDVLGLKLM